MNSKRISRIFFVILAIFFLITAPAIIFYSLGYRYSLERGVFVYGGSITIKSNPESVNITIDGKAVPQRKINFINNYYHIDGIHPGKHQISVSADGFSSWDKTAEVHSGVSTEFWNIILTRNDYPEENINVSSPTQRFFPSPKNDYLALTYSVGDNFSVSIYDLGDDTEEEFFSSREYSFTSDPKENIEWSPQENKLLIPTEKSGEKNYYIVDIETKNASKLTDLAKMEGIHNARWDSDKKNTLYFMAKNALYRLSTDSNNLQLMTENISDYDLSGSRIYFFRNDSGIVYQIPGDNPEKIEQITTSPPPDMADTNYRIIVYDEERIAILNDRTKKLCVYNMGENDTYVREIGKEIEDVQFSNDGKKILFWSDHEIYCYFARDWEVQPIRSEDDLINITRYSQPIRNVQWLKDYEHIIFSAGNTLKVIELDYRDRHIGMDISSVENDAWIFSDFSSDRIYISSPTRTSNNFYFITFPEYTGFFGE